MESDHGYFWVERFENDQPSIAYRTKGGSWLFIGVGENEYTKLMKKTGWTHPHKILKKVIYE